MTEVKMPEPSGRMPYPFGYLSRHTDDQMKQYGDDRAREALEMAAIEIKVEADYSGSNRRAVLTWAVDKLRALKEQIK